MSSIKKLVSFTLLACLFVSCNNIIQNDWASMVPDETPFIILPARDATLQEALHSQYIPLLDDVSSSSIALIQEIDSTASNALQLKSILLYPGADQKLQPVWILRAPSDFMDRMKETYGRRFAQNYYYFRNIPVLKMYSGQRFIFAAQIDDILLVSESSLGIENSIRVYRGDQAGAPLEEVQMKPGSFIINTPSLDTWITEQAKVSYYPFIQNAFDGSQPALLQINQKDSAQGGGLTLSGTIQVSRQPESTLIKGLSAHNKPITLDKFISFDAVAFALFRLPPLTEIPETLPDTTSADSAFIENDEPYQNLSNSLSSELAMVMYAKSGINSVNEYAFIRKLKNAGQLQNTLDELVESALIEKTDDVYFVRSTLLGHLFGSKLYDVNNFYIKIIDEVAIIAQRKGLTELIASDYQRRQTVIYEPYYKKIKSTLPQQISGLALGGPKLLNYLNPFLKSNSYVNALTALFDYAAISTSKDGSSMAFTLSTFNVETQERPFIENWTFSTDATLSGEPIFANIEGSSNQEIIFSTTSGNIYVLAADGTVIQRRTTDGEQPIGSPVAYDWYGTGQKIILIAAGNKIFAWDESGNMLPQFPFELDETISTPLTIADVNNNGLPDIIVGTVNRKLHVLNARGEPIIGWPVTTNAIVKTRPLVTNFQNRNAVVAYASNAVHVWNAAGRSFAGFPRFIDASFTGSPRKLNESILGAAADGYLYAFGRTDQFDNSLNVNNERSFFARNTEALYISGQSLSGTPLVTDESRIVVMDTNGSVYVLDDDGTLSLTESMGQPPAAGWTPIVTDLDNDENTDVIALADYGRIYAWNINSSERINELPTAAMNHVSIGDLDGDGLMEIVGKTEEGLQAWTIN